jgi:hypothetical protein
VSREDLEVYLRCIFKVVFAVEEATDVDPAVLAAKISRDCFAETGADRTGRMTVAQFKRWYNPVQDAPAAEAAPSTSGATALWMRVWVWLGGALSWHHCS